MSINPVPTAAGADATHLLRAYRTMPGVPDELISADGDVRPVWGPLLQHLASLSPDELQSRFTRGERYLHDAGVFYRKYGDEGATERDWPLSHVPVLIDNAEWQALHPGLIQRANLLEALVRDIYGANRLVADGDLPASLIAQNPGWLRPMVGVEPVGGTFLNFLAFDLGRGPDGQWWVLGDRTEAPSGAGFAVENRVATARIFPNFFARADVYRLAGFFRDFQRTLTRPRRNAEGQIAILTPGPMNDAYFEHTFIARYLGLLLAEGEDLTVRDGTVMVRTVDGLQPVRGLWRRLDAQTCDPLELDHDSRLGTAGLVEAVRLGKVAMTNALGTGVLETRALMAFMPQLCQRLTGAPLQLPNIATWWCGQPAEQAHVLANRDRMMIGSAYSTRLPFDGGDGTTLGGDLRPEAGTGLETLLQARGRDLVGQEAVTLSTTPVWQDGGLVPRPMVLRVFLARTGKGWTIMPGGYARIGSAGDPLAIAMQRGGSVADVWVVSDTPVPRATMLRSSDDLAEVTTDAALPSRAGDNLFWMGRYVERAEGHMRLFRAYHARLAEGVDADAPLLAAVRQTLGAEPDIGEPTVAQLAQSFAAPLKAALACADRLRDRFSADGMMALQDIADATQRFTGDALATEEIPRRVSILLNKITGFAGLVHENMYRSVGWRFLSLGLSLERAATMAGTLAALGHDDAPDGAFDLLLEAGDSSMTHRLRYSVGATPETVTDLLALDTANPRAIQYHLIRAREHIDHLPRAKTHGRPAPVARLALACEARLAVATAGSLTPETLTALRNDIWKLSEMVSATYFR